MKNVKRILSNNTKRLPNSHFIFTSKWDQLMNWSALYKRMRTAPKSTCDVFQADLEGFTLQDLKSLWDYLNKWKIQLYVYKMSLWPDHVCFPSCKAQTTMGMLKKHRARKQNKHDFFFKVTKIKPCSVIKKKSMFPISLVACLFQVWRLAIHKHKFEINGGVWLQWSQFRRFLKESPFFPSGFFLKLSPWNISYVTVYHFYVPSTVQTCTEGFMLTVRAMTHDLLRFFFWQTRHSQEKIEFVEWSF